MSVTTSAEPEFGTPAPGTTPIERPGAYAVAIDDHQLLVVETPAGLYLPGGGTEPGEDVEPALRREVREETGYDVVAATMLGTARQHLKSGTVKIESFFLVSIAGEIAQGESDHLPRWMPIDDAIGAMVEDAQSWAIGLARDSVSGA